MFFAVGMMSYYKMVYVSLMEIQWYIKLVACINFVIENIPKFNNAQLHFTYLLKHIKVNSVNGAV